MAILKIGALKDFSVEALGAVARPSRTIKAVRLRGIDIIQTEGNLYHRHRRFAEWEIEPPHPGAVNRKARALAGANGLLSDLRAYTAGFSGKAMHYGF